MLQLYRYYQAHTVQAYNLLVPGLLSSCHNTKVIVHRLIIMRTRAHDNIALDASFCCWTFITLPLSTIVTQIDQRKEQEEEQVREGEEQE